MCKIWLTDVKDASVQNLGLFKLMLPPSTNTELHRTEIQTESMEIKSSTTEKKYTWFMLETFQTMWCFLLKTLGLTDTSVNFVNFSDCNWQFFFCLIYQLNPLVSEMSGNCEKCRWQFSKTQTVIFMTFCSKQKHSLVHCHGKRQQLKLFTCEEQ